MEPTERLVQCIRERRFEDARDAWEALGPSRFGDPFLVELGANIHANLGRFDEEIELWGRLFGMTPSDSRVARSYAAALMEKRRLEEATGVLQAFVENHPDVEACCLLANVLTLRGRLSDALAAISEARQLDPEQPTVAALHAGLLARNGHPGWARAIAEGVERTQPFDNATCRELARTWRALRQFDRAITWFTRALEADHADMETAVALAATYEQAREPEIARRMAEAALTVDPDLVGMERLLVRLDHYAGRLPEARARAEALLTRDLPDEGRRGILLELALVEQRAERWEAAFHHATRGNELARTTFERAGLDVRQFSGIIERVLDYRAVRTAPPRADDRPAPVFLVGVPRSGTTLTQQILQAHPDIETLDELETGVRVLRNHLSRQGVDVPYPAHLDLLDDGDWHELRRQYWEDLDDAGIGRAHVLVDKLPLSLVRMHYLSQLFPDGKMIVVVRDPRDALWSNFLQDYEPNPFTAACTDLGETARLIDLTLRLWEQWRDHPPLPALEVRYEELVTAPEPTVRRLLAHVGVEYSDRCLAFHEQAATRSIKTPSYQDVSKPLYSQAAGRWRHYEAWLAPHLPRLDHVVRAFGYPPTEDPEPTSSLTA